MILSGGINLSKIDKTNPKHIKKINGQWFLDITIMDGDTKFGDGSITINQSKEDRLAKEPKVYLGSWKYVYKGERPPKKPAEPKPEEPKKEPVYDDEFDDVPF